jgi:Fe-S-cluster containining protein
VSEQALLAELGALYDDVDALYVGASCDRSTECCRFGITGREPQVTSLELALVARALRQRGGQPGPKQRALPLAGDSSLAHRGPARATAAREGACPLLLKSGRCAVYEARPLGCRTFFCQRAQLAHPVDRHDLRDAVRRLQELAVRHAPGGDRPRALSRALDT